MSQELTKYNGSLIHFQPEQFEEWKKQILEKHRRVSKKVTPKQMVKKRPDGYDYVNSAYMSEMFEEEYGPPNFVGSHNIVYAKVPLRMQIQEEVLQIKPDGSEGRANLKKDVVQFVETPIWITYDGVLTFYDEGMLRQVSGHGASRVQYKKGQPTLPENIIDIDKQIKAARTNAMKDAMSRGGRIADDVYKRQMSEELDEKTLKSFLFLLEKADENLRSRYQKYVDNAGGVENASEDLVQSWIDGLKRKLGIEDEGELKQPGEIK